MRPLAGRLRDRVTILELSEADDISGHPEETYANTTTISPAEQWAEVIQTPGLELERSDSLVSQSPFTVTFGYIGALTTEYRLQLENSDVLEIESVTHDQRRTHTICGCTRTTAG